MTASNGGVGRGPHLGELAELDALGALEPDDRAAVDAHAAACVTCSLALAESAATLAALDAAFVPQRAAPRQLAARIAAAARSHPFAGMSGRTLPAWYAMAAARGKPPVTVRS